MNNNDINESVNEEYVSRDEVSADETAAKYVAPSTQDPSNLDCVEPQETFDRANVQAASDASMLDNSIPGMDEEGDDAAVESVNEEYASRKDVPEDETPARYVGASKQDAGNLDDVYPGELDE